MQLINFIVKVTNRKEQCPISSSSVRSNTRSVEQSIIDHSSDTDDARRRLTTRRLACCAKSTGNWTALMHARRLTTRKPTGDAESTKNWTAMMHARRRPAGGAESTRN